MRCLIADDYDDVREALKLAMEHAGWEVFAAKDGREALRIYHDAIESGYFDVLLLDVNMPLPNGLSVGVLVRYFEGFAEIPRAAHIYLTGEDDVVPPHQLLEAELAGTTFANAYIRKPIAADELLAEIDKLIAK